MRRADRLFQIIQILRRSTLPVTWAALAAELEVSTRTVYRACRGPDGATGADLRRGLPGRLQSPTFCRFRVVDADARVTTGSHQRVSEAGRLKVPNDQI